MAQQWRDLTFLHWAVEAELAQRGYRRGHRRRPRRGELGRARASGWSGRGWGGNGRCRGWGRSWRRTCASTASTGRAGAGWSSARWRRSGSRSCSARGRRTGCRTSLARMSCRRDGDEVAYGPSGAGHRTGWPVAGSGSASASRSSSRRAGTVPHRAVGAARAVGGAQHLCTQRARDLAAAPCRAAGSAGRAAGGRALARTGPAGAGLGALLGGRGRGSGFRGRPEPGPTTLAEPGPGPVHHAELHLLGGHGARNR